MGCNRITVRLDQLGEVVGGATPSTKNSKYWGGDIPWLSPKDLTGYKYRYISRGEKDITTEGFCSCSTKLLPKGSVLFSSRAPIGYCAIAANPVCTNQGFKSIVPKEGVDSEFLYYLLCANKDSIAGTGSGTTFPEVSGKTMRQFEVIIPECSGEQKVIARVLGTLDTKIELNTRINGYLSELVSAIFRRWFVEFGPFSEEAMKGSEIGPIPKSVTLAPLEDITEVITKGTTPTTLGYKYTDSGINFIKGESILDNHSFDYGKFSHIDETTNEALRRSIIQDRDLLFTIAGTLGRFAMVEPGMLPANTNQAVGIVRVDRNKLLPESLLSYFMGGWQNDFYARRVQQAVQANLSLATLKALPVPVLEGARRTEYESQIVPLIKTIEANNNESRKLTELRDGLLPKLMFGEIDVSKVDPMQLNSHLSEC